MKKTSLHHKLAWLAVSVLAGATVAACSSVSSSEAQVVHAQVLSAQAGKTSGTANVKFAGRGILVLADADMAATAYGDGVLKRTAGVADSLLVLDTSAAPKVVGTLEVTNSVIGWPEVLDVSPDGKFAYVAETRGVPAAGVEKVEQVFKDFPAGKFLTVVDVSKLDAPRQVQKLDLGKNLGAARVSADGKTLASVSDVAGKELVLATLVDGLVQHVDAFAINTQRDSKSRQGARSVAWHPASNVLAVNIADREVQFFSVSRSSDGRPTAIKTLGAPVVVGQTLSSGYFSKSGKHFLMTDLGWGDNAKATDFLFNGSGQLVVLAFDPAGKHRVASQTPVGLSPESMAISRDGTLLVTVNMNRTYLPDSFPGSIWPKRQRSSLSLASFDDLTGQVKVLQELEFEGVLPENAVFDTQDKTLAVAIYEQRGDNPRKGAIEFWSVVSDNGRPQLQATGQRLQVSRGAHDLAVLP